MRARVLGGVVALFALTVSVRADGPSTDPRAFNSRHMTAKVGDHRIELTLATPESGGPPPFLVVFASGDGGLRGGSKEILEHLAGRGYWVVGLDTNEAFEKARKVSGPNYAVARATFASLVTQARKALAVPDATRIVVTGMSRGASVVIAAAGDPTLKPGIVGAVAIALTREFDELTVPESAKARRGVETDEQGRLRTYPAITRLGGLPLAVIQSTNDGYVKSAESRRLLGPDTPTRRLYEVKAKNHSFRGGKEALMRDLDDAMTWIGGFSPTR